jgi:hypothetical protein
MGISRSSDGTIITPASAADQRSDNIMDYRDKQLVQPDIFHLDAASGWLGLGDVVSANDELKQISPAMREHPAVLLAQ